MQRSPLTTVFSLCLIAILLVLTAAGVSAQTFRGYLTAGFNGAQIDGDMLAGYNRFGGYAGVGVWTDLADKWRTSLTIAYNQGGSRASGPELARAQSPFENIRLDYVSVPLTLHFMDYLSADERYYRLEFMGTIEYRRLITSTITDISGLDITNTFSANPNGLAIGLGALYSVTERLGAGIYLDQSVTDAQNNPINRRLLTKSLSLRARYAF